jgi:hypothetical protein
MLKFSRALAALALLATTLAAAGIAWAAPTHTSLKSATSTQTITVTIPAQNSSWTDTGVALVAHHTVMITARGTINYGLGPSLPGGKPLANFSCAHFNGPSSSFIARNLRCWSLIGRIGNGNPFQVSGLVNVTDSAAGELFLMMNDDIFGDNSGSWTVTITTS